MNRANRKQHRYPDFEPDGGFEEMTLNKGAKIGHYEILNAIGAGGMGEVFLARDTRLERQVAIKLLGEEFSDHADRLHRFTQEARSASALNHPNILTIHEIGETETGARFIATEYVEGETLRHRIRHSQMKLREVLDIVVQVTSALAAAHQVGIIHRDIKPENLMLRPDGLVKVLDFGLAKLTEKSTPTNDSEVGTISHKGTDPGTVMGTVQYMSPEQARGRKVDARSDIFSLGIVLYELVAGRPPFAGESSTDVLAAILEKEPLPLLRFVAEVPPELQRIVTKCLRKDCDERYQTMKDVLLDLKELRDELALEARLERFIRPVSNIENQQTPIADGERTKARSAQATSPASAQPASSAEYIVSKIKNHKRSVAVGLILLFTMIGVGYWLFILRPPTAKPIESIAVMPFVDESGNSDVEYLSDGMTETLISSLSQVPNLNVKPRSSVFRYKGKETNSQTLGKELNVQAILNGRVVQRGQDLSLYMELIDVALDKVIWSRQYNRKQTGLVTLQTDIARDVSSQIKTKLSSADEATVTKTYTTNPEAYQLYLKGKYYANKFTKEGFQQSIESLNQAIAIDPNYSSAYSGLAYAYILLDDWFESPRESAPKARETAQKALAINEEDVDAHVVLGMVAHWYDWDWATAEREFKRSLELNPKNSDSYTYYAFFLAAMKRDDEARLVARQGLQVDPLSSGTNFSLAATLIFRHRWDEAIEHLRKAIELDPNYWFHHSYLGRAYAQKGMMPEAIAEFKLALELDSQQSENWAGLGQAYAVSGKKAEAQKMIDEMIKRSSQNIYVAPYNVAVIYAGLADKDKAFEWLEKAYSDRAYYLSVYLTTDERLDSLRSDPRFKDLVRRIGIPE